MEASTIASLLSEFFTWVTSVLTFLLANKLLLVGTIATVGFGLISRTKRSVAR